MFHRILAHWRKDRFAKEHGPVAEWNIELLATANANLALQLERAAHTIKYLTARLVESDLLLAHAQARVGDFQYATLPLSEDLVERPAGVVSSKQVRRLKWIDNIWLCTGLDYLKDTEAAWKMGDVGSARCILETTLTTSPFLSVAEMLHSRVLLAAILYGTGEYHASLSQVGCVMNVVSSRSKIQSFRYRDIVNKAYFIEAMDFMALEKFERAYWSFSRALQLPGYRDRAREYQIKAIEEFTRQQACDEGADDSLSLRPIISLDGCLPIPADSDDNPRQHPVW